MTPEQKDRLKFLKADFIRRKIDTMYSTAFENCQKFWYEAAIDSRFTEFDIASINPLWEKFKEDVLAIAIANDKIMEFIDLSVSYRCKTCHRKTFYFTKYDASWCTICEKWLDEKCGHEYPECYSECSTRPDNPMELLT